MNHKAMSIAQYQYYTRVLFGLGAALVDSLVRPLREVLTVLLFLAVTARLAQRQRARPPV